MHPDRCPARHGDWYCYLDTAHPGNHVAYGSPTEPAICWPNTRRDTLKTWLGSVIDLRHTGGYEPQARAKRETG